MALPGLGLSVLSPFEVPGLERSLAVGNVGNALSQAKVSGAIAAACILAFSLAFHSSIVIFDGSCFFSGCGAVRGRALELS